MPLDPSIPLGVKPVQFESPVNMMGQMYQLQNAAQANQLNQMKMQEMERDVGERNALRPIVSRAGFDISNPEHRREVIAAAPVAGQEWLNKMATGAKTMAEVDTAKLAQTKAQLGLASQILSIAKDQPSYEAALQKLQANGLPIQQMPTAFDPKYVQSELMQGVAMDKQLDHELAKQRVSLEQQRVGLEGKRVGLEERRVGLAEKMQGTEGLNPKEIQKREAALPQATSAIKGFEAKSDSFVRDLEALRNHPGLNQITGVIAGRAPALTSEGRAAQALYDKIVAKGGFQALQDLRDASKTGGALGNVSNQEGRQLSASFAAIDRKQDAADVRAAIDQAIGDVQGAKTRMREAYDSTYSYKTGGVAEPAAPAAKPTAAPVKGVKFLGFE